MSGVLLGFVRCDDLPAARVVTVYFGKTGVSVKIFDGSGNVLRRQHIRPPGYVQIIARQLESVAVKRRRAPSNHKGEGNRA